MRRVRAQALVEFALVVPVLLMLMCCVFEFGWAFYSSYQLNNAARLAARFGATQGTYDYAAIVEAAQKSSGGVFFSANPMVVVSTIALVERGKQNTFGGTAPPRSSGDLFTVYLQYKYWPFTRLVDLRSFGAPEHFRVSSTFVVP